MAKSRYSGTDIIDGRHYETYALPRRSAGLQEIDLLENVRTFEHTFSQGERLDHLAELHLGDGAYWWVIALVNSIDYPFASGGLVPGRKLRIPLDVRDVLDKILR